MLNYSGAPRGRQSAEVRFRSYANSKLKGRLYIVSRSLNKDYPNFRIVLQTDGVRDGPLFFFLMGVTSGQFFFLKHVFKARTSRNTSHA